MIAAVLKYPLIWGDGDPRSSAATVPAWPTEWGRASANTFLLKLLAAETAILITVGLLAVMGRDYFAWLLS